MTETLPTEEIDAGEIDLSLLLAVLWKRRKLIVLGTLGMTLLSILISLYIPRVYMSEGFYQLGSVKTDTVIKTISNIKESSTSFTAVIGVPIQLYKRISPQFSDPHYFRMIASQDKSLNEEMANQVVANFRSAADINQWIKPIYAHAKEDAREFVPISKDEFNSVIGLNLSYEANSPERANGYVRFLGEYVRNCILYANLFNYVRNEYSHALSTMNRYENDIIDIQFQLLQNTNKLNDIRALLTKYPESAKIENRQVVSVQEGGNRFLAPVTQLVGIESTLADLRRTLAELQRGKEKCSIRAEYFSRCNSELTKVDRSGESLFILLQSIKEDVFKNKDSSKDTVKEVLNNLNIDQQAFELAFFNDCRFVSGPTIPDSPIKPQRRLIVIVSSIASFFSMVILSFVLHWLKSHREKFVSANSKLD